MRELAHLQGAHGNLRELALFAGAGGGILGGHILGWRTVCAVEHDTYAASVLCARQNDGALPPFPIWDDVRTFDGRPWRGCVDVVSGGFPCQDISCAGKGAGITGERSGLWSEMARIVGEVRPRFVFVENSPNLVSRGLAVVLSDLAALGYDARWCVLGADDAGAPHRRKRIWIVACDTNSNREPALPVDDEISGLREYASDAVSIEHESKPSAQRRKAGENVSANPAGDRRYERRPQPARDEGGSSPFISGANVADTSSARCGEGGRPAGGEIWDEARGQESERRGGDVPDAYGGLRDGRADEPGRGPQERAAADGACEAIPDAQEPGRQGTIAAGDSCPGGCAPEHGQRDGRPDWWTIEPAIRGMVDGMASELDQHGAAAAGYLGRVATGVPARVDQLKCLGNGQVPLCAAMAWTILTAPDGEGEKP